MSQYEFFCELQRLAWARERYANTEAEEQKIRALYKRFRLTRTTLDRKTFYPSIAPSKKLPSWIASVYWEAYIKAIETQRLSK